MMLIERHWGFNSDFLLHRGQLGVFYSQYDQVTDQIVVLFYLCCWVGMLSYDALLFS